MTRYIPFILLVAISFNALAADLPSNKRAEKPTNLVVIMTDDLGYSGHRQLWFRD